MGCLRSRGHSGAWYLLRWLGRGTQTRVRHWPYYLLRTPHSKDFLSPSQTQVPGLLGTLGLSPLQGAPLPGD